MGAPPETLDSLWLAFLPANRDTGQISLQAQENAVFGMSSSALSLPFMGKTSMF